MIQMPEIEIFISQRISQLRLAKGVSAREMSLSIGQSTGYINNIENKISLPSMKGLSYICEYFDISLAEFFDEANPHPAYAHEIVAELRFLNAEQLTTVLAVIRGLKK
jgi:transcriptional regulator with XRE-family HTH domain